MICLPWSMNVTTAFLRRPPVLTALAVLIVLLAAAAFWYKPWGLIVNDTVNEAAPISVAVTSPPEVGAASAAPATAAPATRATTVPAAAVPAPAALSGLNRTGNFVPGEHDIRGTARFIQTGQGVILRLENLRTTNGPDVRVYLSTRTHGLVGAGDFLVAPIKANIGSQNYLLPAGTDVSKYASVVIWCERFSVGFGHAVLRA